MALSSREVQLAYGDSAITLRVPANADVLVGRDPPPLPDPEAAVATALVRPIGAAPLVELVRARAPRRVAISISDITRPVPNQILLPPLLAALHAAGVCDEQIDLVIGNGMHRPSTEAERLRMIGHELLGRLRVIDHRADRSETLLDLRRDPPLRVNRTFAEADLRIVTGLIEPHFMAGFSGGAKGVCPALVDLDTIRDFHSYATLSQTAAALGVLEGNPCQAIALEVAERIGVDFLLNVTITRGRRLAGVYAGELRAAHHAGCTEVAAWSTVELSHPYDLCITSGGGLPLDETFYQTVKGMVGAIPALHGGSVLLQVSRCGEGLGSAAYAELLCRWGQDWRGFLAHLAAHPGITTCDQWELQMQARVLDRIGIDQLWLVSDGLSPEELSWLALRPVEGHGPAQLRTQRALDELLASATNRELRVAVVPDGPYTLLQRGSSAL